MVPARGSLLSVNVGASARSSSTATRPSAQSGKRQSRGVSLPGVRIWKRTTRLIAPRTAGPTRQSTPTPSRTYGGGQESSVARSNMASSARTSRRKGSTSTARSSENVGRSAMLFWNCRSHVCHAGDSACEWSTSCFLAASPRWPARRLPANRRRRRRGSLGRHPSFRSTRP